MCVCVCVWGGGGGGYIKDKDTWLSWFSLLAKADYATLLIA